MKARLEFAAHVLRRWTLDLALDVLGVIPKRLARAAAPCPTCGGCERVDDPALIADSDVPRGSAWMPCPHCVPESIPGAMHFQVKPHSVEVWIGDEFVATVTASDAPSGGLRITSKYLAGPVTILEDLAPITMVEVEFVGVP